MRKRRSKQIISLRYDTNEERERERVCNMNCRNKTEQVPLLVPATASRFLNSNRTEQARAPNLIHADGLDGTTAMKPQKSLGLKLSPSLLLKSFTQKPRFKRR